MFLLGLCVAEPLPKESVAASWKPSILFVSLATSLSWEQIMARVLAIGIGILLLAGGAPAALFDQFVVFGDSLSDNGNAFLGTGGATPAPPLYTVGRFTDGPDTSPAGTVGGIWHEVLSGLLGEPVATPFLAGGTNFAVGGAKILSGDPIIPSLAQQVGLALSGTGGHADPNALYIIWGGANDLY
jgi:outer membrane lipase/esterase